LLNQKRKSGSLRLFEAQWVLEKIFAHTKLGKMGDVILNLLNGSSTQLKVNQEVYDQHIPLEKGTKQGDGISPVLFNLFMSPLLWRLRKETAGVKVNGFTFNCAAIMDDVVYAADSSKGGELSSKIVLNYSSVTGINISSNKSAYAWLNTKDQFIPTVNGKNFELLGSDKSYKYLGFWVNLDLNYADLQEHLICQIRVVLNLITSKYYLPPGLMVKLINATVMAIIGYRMQVIMFSQDWINKVERLIVSFLVKATGIHNYSYAMWTISTGLTSLSYLNSSRMFGSITRSMQNPAAICNENLVKLLSRPPNPIPLYRPPKWIEPQDALNQACLHWYHHRIAHLIPPPHLPPYLPPTLPSPNLSRTDIKAWGDVSLIREGDSAKMASALSTIEYGTLAWPIHGPVSSTEAEIQSMIGYLHLFPECHQLVFVSDSLGAVNAAATAKRLNHTNLHKMANPVSLRMLNSYTKNRVVKIVKYPVNLPYPSLQLIHMYSHSDKDEDRYKANVAKFKRNAHTYIEQNGAADEAAKAAAVVTNLGPSPFHPYADPLTLFSPAHPHMDYKDYLKYISNLIEQDRFKAKELTKANRWAHKAVDIVATTYPIKFGPKGVARFSILLLNSMLPTKPTVRRSKWFKNGAKVSAKKKAAYNNNLCNQCNVEESHVHIFNECPNRIPLREELKKEIAQILLDTAQLRFSSLPWWFNMPNPISWIGDPTHAKAICNDMEDLGWRGFIPNGLYNLFITYTTAEKSDIMCKKIAMAIAFNNHKIWKSRCDTLFDNQKQPSPTSSSTP
jgi:hypothetical protein